MIGAFEKAFAVVVGNEGGFTDNPSDPGNWTGKAVGVGRLVGTRWGVSAAAYPGVDIARLTLDGARAIYRRDYWNKVRGDDLPPALALLVFDAAINNGPDRAARWLQTAVGAMPDGMVGSRTVALAHAAGREVMAEMVAQRLAFMAGLPTWRTFGLGWARRLCRLPYDAMSMEDVA